MPDNNQSTLHRYTHGSLDGDLKFACANCRLHELCVTAGISSDELDRLDSMVSQRRAVKAGSNLFSKGERFHALFAIRSGCFKTRLSSEDGREQITGFQMAGELLGLDGVAGDVHNVDAVALEDSELCVLPYDNLETIAQDFPPLQQQLHRVMSREIVRDHAVLMLLGSMRSDERVAAFLLNLSQRFVALGYSPMAFTLRMTREDIGNYLGLKIETVSRTLTRLQKDALIRVDGKSVELLDMNGLRHLAGVGTPGDCGPGQD